MNFSQMKIINQKLSPLTSNITHFGLRSFLNLMTLSKFTIGRKMIQDFINSNCYHTKSDYERALQALCNLQSNRAYLDSVTPRNNSLADMEQYILRSGLSWDCLNELSIIHVTGTKGKGSTCAYVESILRKFNYKTGFFSSPHLVSIRERIRIDGKPLNESMFAHYFWKVYNKLNATKDDSSDMPMYFKFLVILMFHVFLELKVDVAIIEVGIGGELDSTNVIKNPVCVGVTNIALDHTLLLGSTVELIAYQKSGIFKPKSIAFTVPQSPEIMDVLRKRALERDCQLNIVTPSFDNISKSRAQNYNASLAVELAVNWMKIKGNNNLNNSNKIIEGLIDCKWPGRTQILHSSFADFYLDGAHTLESMDNCINWFENMTNEIDRKKRLLIFNISGSRDPIPLMNLLKPLNFERVYFVPNHSGTMSIDNQFNTHNCLQSQLTKCQDHCRIWNDENKAKWAESIVQVLELIKKDEQIMKNHGKIHILVTGSLHLIGAVLHVIDPELTMNI